MPIFDAEFIFHYEFTLELLRYNKIYYLFWYICNIRKRSSIRQFIFIVPTRKYPTNSRQYDFRTTITAIKRLNVNLISTKLRPWGHYKKIKCPIKGCICNSGHIRDSGSSPAGRVVLLIFSPANDFERVYDSRG